MSDIIIQPDNPLSTLTLFDADKKSLEFFASCIELEVKEGRENALRIEAIAKKTIKTMEDILSRIKQNSINEAAKYGEHPFSFANCEMHYTATKTEYEYAGCNDPEWMAFQSAESNMATHRKQREAFLKTLKDPVTIVSEETGELIKINPPLKKQWMGVKVTIK